LLKSLGPEPLGAEFDADYLAAMSRNRRVAIKQHLMNANVVVGLGNIYANEALFRAGIHLLRAAGRIAKARFEPLVAAARRCATRSTRAVRRCATSSVATASPDTSRSLRVYERNGLPCVTCGTAIERRVLGQRATYYCPRCQR
jgi:formamidopyrimidine-DNA glycosylase